MRNNIRFLLKNHFHHILFHFGLIKYLHSDSLPASKSFRPKLLQSHWYTSKKNETNFFIQFYRTQEQSRKSYSFHHCMRPPLGTVLLNPNNASHRVVYQFRLVQIVPSRYTNQANMYTLDSIGPKFNSPSANACLVAAYFPRGKVTFHAHWLVSILLQVVSNRHRK